MIAIAAVVAPFVFIGFTWLNVCLFLSHDTRKVYQDVCLYYKQLNDMQEEIEVICENMQEKYQVNFIKQSVVLYQKSGEWKVKIRNEDDVNKDSIYEFYSINNKQSIESLNENFCEPIYHVFYDGEVYRFDVGDAGEYECIYYIPNKEAYDNVQAELKEYGLKYKRVRGKWYRIVKTRKTVKT